MKKLENKKFEYTDDNPGAYFGMLIESVGDKVQLKEKDNSSNRKNSNIPIDNFFGD